MRSMRRGLTLFKLAIRGRVLQNLAQLRSWYGMPGDALQELQRRRLGELLEHAYKNVPYYRRVLGAAGVFDSSGSIRHERFSQIPCLGRDELSENFDQLKSLDLTSRRWRVNSSGGSTGEPVRFIQDNGYADWSMALKLLYDEWTDCRISDAKVLLWGSERDLFVGRETFRTRLGRWLKNEIWLNAFRMDLRRMQDYLDELMRAQPRQILAYADSIYELAQFAGKAGIQPHQPKAIMTSAGTLHPHMREVVERVFRAPVYNRYGSREAGDMACECSHHQGLHVSPLTHHIEILRSDGTPAAATEPGEIVITLLTNFAMPLVRYRIGDMGAWSSNQCTCGSSWPLLQEVTGRITDVFRKRDGSVVLPEYFIHVVGVVLNTGWIRKYQVVQEDFESIRVLIVPSEQTPDFEETYAGEVNTIIDRIKLVMGRDTRVVITFVEDIPRTASGKYRYTISRIL